MCKQTVELSADGALDGTAKGKWKPCRSTYSEEIWVAAPYEMTTYVRFLKDTS